jgi:hypothetical protein
VVVIECLVGEKRENEDVGEDMTNIEPSESSPIELGQKGQNPRKKKETRLS